MLYATDPLFVNAAADTLTLGAGSPAIDAGDSAAIAAYTTTDLAGNERIDNDRPDLGAYEAITAQPVPLAMTLIYPLGTYTSCLDDVIEIGIAFNQTVMAGTGSFHLVDVDMDDTVSVDISSATISDTLITVSLSHTLSYGGTYYLLLDSGAVQDEDGADFGGITDSNTWAFAPPAADAGGVTIIDFEVADAGYVSDTTQGSGDKDLFNRTNHDFNQVANEDGHYWACEDFAGTPSITIDQINVTGSSSFDLSIDLLAARYRAWDNGDYMKITYSLDGGSDQDLFAVAKINDGATTNGVAAVDTDFDGFGECGDATTLPSILTGTQRGCTVSSSDFATFRSEHIELNNNSTLDIKITFSGLDRDSEGIYLDNIIISQSPYSFANGQEAGLVIGQDDLYSDGSATTVDGLSDPRGVAIDTANGKAYVCDRSNNRILRYSLPMVSGNDAELVYGQTDFTSSGIDSTSTTLNQPIGIEVDSDGNLWVADAKNNRVLRYDNAYLDNANGAAADLVLGQAGFGTATESTTASGLAVPRDMHVDSDGTLWIADYKNNRVLRYDNAASLTSGASADGVLGQADFTSNTGGTTASTMEGASGISSRQRHALGR